MSSINEAMNLTMEKLREMVDVNTVVGKPITTPDGTTLIPVSKVTFGFASGGTDGTNIRFGAGSGAGVTISPQAYSGKDSTQVAEFPQHPLSLLYTSEPD